MRNFLFIICCAAAGFLAGCSDDTNSVGNNLIGGNEKFTIADTTVGIVSDTVFNVSAPNGFGAVNVVGKTADAESKMWFRILTGALADSLGSWAIDTVELRLHAAYTWNAPSSPAEFEIREAISGWTQNGAARDSLSNLQIGAAVLGRITQRVAVGDTIAVRLDTAAVRRMLAFSYNTAAASPFHGFVIVPKPGTTTGMIGFASSVNALGGPSLTVRISRNGVRDSIVFLYSEDTFIATATATTNPEIEVRGGVSTWSKLKLDVGFIPPMSIINNATLELTQKSASTLLGAGTPDSLYAYISKKNGTVSTIDSTYRVLGKRKENTSSVDPVYVFNLTPLVQFLIVPGTVYDGLVLHAADNIQSVDHRVFYSSKDADASKRPRLLITTSKK